uniref:Uncharacterized protein n=1 Tax=Tanacetum cinerariifolium TaxID=118510 RepID=A0A6L2M0H6_TANCI|nr:hypothetical protein [Tanacetum cinerariifolium]
MHRTTSALGHLTPLLLKENLVLHEDDLVLQDALQVRLAEQKSHDELEATQNVEKVKEHLLAEEIKKLEPRSDKESPEVENISKISQLVNVIKEEEESAEDDYELKQRDKGKHVEEIRNTLSPTTIRSPRIQSTLVSSNTEKLQELIEFDPTPSSSTPTSSSPKTKLSTTNRLLSLFKSKPGRFRRYKSFLRITRTLWDGVVAKLVDDRIKGIIKTQVPLHIAQGLILEREKIQANVATTPCRPYVVRPRDQDDPHDDAHPEGENSAKRQKSSEYETFILGESSSGQDYKIEPGPSMSGNQEQSDDFDFWTNSYALDDDVLPNEKVSQELVDEISQTVDEAKLHKVVDEMLRQQCTSGDEHQYHIDQMQNFFKSDIVWESRKEILVTPFQPKPTPVVQSCQRDLKALGLPLVNQDLLYLKKGNSGPENKYWIKEVLIGMMIPLDSQYHAGRNVYFRDLVDFGERFDSSAGNPVKEILLKLNLPDHRILKDGGKGT